MSAEQTENQLRLRIAPAVEGDEEWCASLMAASEPWITFKRDLTMTRAALVRPGAELFMACSSAGERLGFILLAAYGLAGAPYIATIAVVPQGRSQGVGSALLDFAEDRYRSRGHLFLLVSSFNTAAYSLYLRRGFRRVGEIPDYVIAGYSELILHKRLA